MNGYEKIIRLIQSLSDSADSLRLGEMTGSNTCKIGELELDKDDLMLPDGVALAAGDNVVIWKQSDELFIILQKVVEA